MLDFITIGVCFFSSFRVLHKFVFLLDTMFLFAVYFNLAKDQVTNLMYRLKLVVCLHNGYYVYLCMSSCLAQVTWQKKKKSSKNSFLCNYGITYLATHCIVILTQVWGESNIWRSFVGSSLHLCFLAFVILESPPKFYI